MQVKCDAIRAHEARRPTACAPNSARTYSEYVTRMPPVGVLDDMSVCRVRKTTVARNCGAQYGADFDKGGYIRPSRAPRGRPMVARCCGILWFIRIGNHLMVGERFRDQVPWLISTERPTRPLHIISIGYVAVPADCAIDDVDVVEAPHFFNGQDPTHQSFDRVMGNLGTRTAMRDDLDGWAYIPDRNGVKSAKAIRIKDIPGFRLDSCDPIFFPSGQFDTRQVAQVNGIKQSQWDDLRNTPWQRFSTEPRPQPQ
ncbi:hypothetical protein N7528_003694 [Penicillium herquei]|nr:hypothetical protein N7528_003694 [Penicillium herquei]